MVKALVTSGPTRERIDPVRYISNDSSGKQGHAIAQALVDAGVEVTLITGPVDLEAPEGVEVINVESAQQMLEAVEQSLPADVAFCVAAVSDWRVEDAADQKIKKVANQDSINLQLVKNPDILATICQHEQRPSIVVGFAAETENVLENAAKKLREKGCELIVANDVSKDVFGSDHNNVTLVSHDAIEEWSGLTKEAIAKQLVELVV